MNTSSLICPLQFYKRYSFSYKKYNISFSKNQDKIFDIFIDNYIKINTPIMCQMICDQSSKSYTSKFLNLSPRYIDLLFFLFKCNKTSNLRPKKKTKPPTRSNISYSFTKKKYIILVVQTNKQKKFMTFQMYYTLSFL